MGSHRSAFPSIIQSLMPSKRRNENTRGKHTVLRVEPQYQVKDLIISPFTHRREYDRQGNEVYIPIERNENPTGIHLLDEFLRRMADGGITLFDYCTEKGLLTEDLSGLLFTLTGLRWQEFKETYCHEMVAHLMLYSDLTVEEIARRALYGSRFGLTRHYQKTFHCSLKEYRDRLRKAHPDVHPVYVIRCCD